MARQRKEEMEKKTRTATLLERLQSRIESAKSHIRVLEVNPGFDPQAKKALEELKKDIQQLSISLLHAQKKVPPRIRKPLRHRTKAPSKSR